MKLVISETFKKAPQERDKSKEPIAWPGSDFDSDVYTFSSPTCLHNCLVEDGEEYLELVAVLHHAGQVAGEHALQHSGVKIIRALNLLAPKTRSKNRNTT